jgi:hypothetical protein
LLVLAAAQEPKQHEDQQECDEKEKDSTVPVESAG